MGGTKQAAAEEHFNIALLRRTNTGMLPTFIMYFTKEVEVGGIVPLEFAARKRPCHLILLLE